MTQGDKELLLKDLCARLPYGVKVKTPYNDAELIGIVKRKGLKKDIGYIDAITNKETYPIQYIQPYLRPISSMTEEEAKYSCISAHKDNIPTVNYLPISDYMTVDWLNAHHFDYRGLIPKGLALEAPKDMYKI